MAERDVETVCCGRTPAVAGVSGTWCPALGVGEDLCFVDTSKARKLETGREPPSVLLTCTIVRC